MAEQLMDVGSGLQWHCLAQRLCCSVSVWISEHVDVCMGRRAWWWPWGAAVCLLCSWGSRGAACQALVQEHGLQVLSNVPI